MAQRMTFVACKSYEVQVLSEYSHIFIYDLPVAASCYERKSSCDRLECIACKVKIFAIWPLTMFVD